MMRLIWSPTVIDISHHPSPQARMPRSFHIRANSSTRSSAAAGIAPSEWLMRYVVSARIGNRSRYSCNSATGREYRDALPGPPNGGTDTRITLRGDSGRPRREYGRRDELAAVRKREKGESDLRNDDGVRGENRGSGLWGTRRGGRGSSEGRNQAVKRGLLVVFVLALAAPLAASAASQDHGRAWRDSY